MNRRKFVAVGASAAAIGAAAGASASAKVFHPAGRGGERVRLTGWLRPAARGPGHYFVLGPRPDVIDPRATDPSLWPADLTLVLPADADAMRPGRATLEGTLYRCRFRDEVTGHAAHAVLTEARQV